MPTTEFGGNPISLTGGIQPAEVDGLPAHELTSEEKLRMVYLTGQDEVALKPDKGEAMTGLLPLEEQIALRVAAGEMES